ncbi:Lsr2 family DNA-binding protein [Streptomyces niveus]|uniref:Lsr2 family DNA-binding protein n=1 Tax=Streptomyces niveus TaxID=193462 RepID=UPI0033AF13D3
MAGHAPPRHLLQPAPQAQQRKHSAAPYGRAAGALADPSGPMTIAALRALIAEELPHIRRLPAPRLPARHFSAKETEPVNTTTTTPAESAPTADPAPLPVGKLLAWAASHPDRTLRDHAEKARTSLDALRERHAAAEELARISTETAELEQRLAQLRARETELNPKRKTRDYDLAEVRAWARSEGMTVPARGRVPGAVVTAWRERAR